MKMLFRRKIWQPFINFVLNLLEEVTTHYKNLKCIINSQNELIAKLKDIEIILECSMVANTRILALYISIYLLFCLKLNLFCKVRMHFHLLNRKVLKFFTPSLHFFVFSCVSICHLRIGFLEEIKTSNFYFETQAILECSFLSSFGFQQLYVIW